MPILMTAPVPGMTAEVYDQIIQNVGDALRAAPGFISHAAVVDAEGLTVTEVWESREQWEDYYTTTVRPNLPPDTPQPTTTELRAGFGR